MSKAQLSKLRSTFEKSEFIPLSRCFAAGVVRECSRPFTRARSSSVFPGLEDLLHALACFSILCEHVIRSRLPCHTRSRKSLRPHTSFADKGETRTLREAFWVFRRVSRSEVIINRDSWGHSCLTVRGESLGFVKDGLPQGPGRARAATRWKPVPVARGDPRRLALGSAPEPRTAPGTASRPPGLRGFILAPEVCLVQGTGQLPHDVRQVTGRTDALVDHHTGWTTAILRDLRGPGAGITPRRRGVNA